MMVDKEKCEKLVDEHAEWFISIMEKIYRDAMRHGYKHGYEDGEKESDG